MTERRNNQHLSPLRYRELITPEDRREGYRLRYEIAVAKLHWIDGDPQTQTETDEWDEKAHHFGAFRGDRLIGYVRMVIDSDEDSIMTRKYFGEHYRRPEPAGLKRHEVADISRLLIRTQETDGTSEILEICDHLYRLAHARAYHLGIKHWFFVTSRRELTALRWRCRFDVRILGSGITSDTKRIYVVYLNLERGRKILKFIAPLRLRWFMGAVAELVPTPQTTLDPDVL